MKLSRYHLSLADGTAIGLRAADGRASAFLDRFARAAMLPVAREKSACTIEVKFTDQDGNLFEERVCLLRSLGVPAEFFCHAVHLTAEIGREVQRRGGVFLHGALAEYRGRGVILAAPGGTGKSTASGRLPRPWRSLCDDTSLLVRDAKGKVRAHPWPTWSRFIDDGSGGVWDTSRAVPLAACFFLMRSSGERADPVGGGEGLALLVESCEQASHSMSRRRGPEETRLLRRERFENLSVIARSVPIHILRLSLKGAFWKEIERALGSEKT